MQINRNNLKSFSVQFVNVRLFLITIAFFSFVVFALVYGKIPAQRMRTSTQVKQVQASAFDLISTTTTTTIHDSTTTIPFSFFPADATPKAYGAPPSGSLFQMPAQSENKNPVPQKSSSVKKDAQKKGTGLFFKKEAEMTAIAKPKSGEKLVIMDFSLTFIYKDQIEDS